tara:strand:+ start:2317 stop:2571 length:255 start_codon:yes stop_codon:yes gene_type:complete
MIIEPLENAVKHTPGALEVNTNINQGGGAIYLTFAVGADMQQAMLDVLTSLNQAPLFLLMRWTLWLLPEETVVPAQVVQQQQVY